MSTALLQIFGGEVAEVPLVATSLDHQGQVTTVSLGVINKKYLAFYLNLRAVWSGGIDCLYFQSLASRMLISYNLPLV